MKPFMWALLLTEIVICAQDMTKPREVSKPPKLALHVMQDFLKTVSNTIMAKAVDVASSNGKTLFLAEELSYRFDKVGLP
jgi:hypothetical protein